MGEPTGVRARAIFRGHVQGVGFRYTTRHIASGYQVTGYVENEPDGSVELVAEGPREAVEGLLEAVSREMAPFIRTREVQWGAATCEFQRFGVRHPW